MEDQASKEFDPTARRLERARSEGDAIRSEEAQAAVSLFVFGLCLALLGAGLGAQIFGNLQILWAQPDRVAFAQRPLREIMLMPTIFTLLPLFLTGLAVLLWLIATRGFVVAGSKLQLKASRISPISNFKQKYGPPGLGDFIRRALKLIGVGALLVWFLSFVAEDLYPILRGTAEQVVAALWARLLQFFWILAAISALFGAADLLWQRYQFLQRNRMTRKEVTDEMKESDGDPHMKADRRRRAQEIANRKMLVDVPKADVVIVNPTHYAVALKWDRKKDAAPHLVAKGVDEMAAQIRNLAIEAGVPLHRDPLTARMLYAQLDLGQQIKREHYVAVAAAIRFADAMRKKARARR